MISRWLDIGQVIFCRVYGQRQSRPIAHLARLDSQSQRRIWIILSTNGASHIINALTVKKWWKTPNHTVQMIQLHLQKPFHFTVARYERACCKFCKDLRDLCNVNLSTITSDRFLLLTIYVLDLNLLFFRTFCPNRNRFSPCKSKP